MPPKEVEEWAMNRGKAMANTLVHAFPGIRGVYGKSFEEEAAPLLARAFEKVAAEQVAQAREEEREACAAVATFCQMPATPEMSPLTHAGIRLARREIAAAIRRRGEG